METVNFEIIHSGFTTNPFRVCTKNKEFVKYNTSCNYRSLYSVMNTITGVINDVYGIAVTFTIG